MKAEPWELWWAEVENLILQYKLLDAISKSLGYGKEITWQEIQNPYIPEGLRLQIEEQNRYNQYMLTTAENVSKMFADTQSNQSK